MCSTCCQTFGLKDNVSPRAGATRISDWTPNRESGLVREGD
jgi:hypothetical protein